MNKMDFSNHTMLAIMQHIDCGLIILDSENHIRWINSYLIELLGLSVDHGTDEQSQRLIEQLLTLTPPIEIYTRQNKTLVFERKSIAFKQAGEILQALYFYNRTPEFELNQNLSQLRDELLRSQFKDPMTGLLNTKAFQLVLEPQIARCRRYGNAISALSLRIHFTQDQDNKDHHAEHIRLISQQLRDLSRWADQLHYDSKGIFTFVLPETPAQEVHHLIDKIDARLKNYPWLSDIHFGVTQWLKSDTLQSFLKRASLALESSEHQNTRISKL